MSSDRRPAKVRVVSASPAGGASAESNPGRRRGDRSREEAEVVAASILAPGEPRRASSVLMLGMIVLFLIGCAVGGGLMVLSGIVSVAGL